MRGIALAILLLLPVHTAHAQVTQAKVEGGVVSGVAENGITIFKGIPFAAPPIGDLRWKAPAPVKPWTGVRKADAFANACFQPPNSQGNTAPVSEDCLYLNVWTPATSATAKLPVIVWVHGGGFTGGSTSIRMYDGTGFAKKGVVLVSLAYRLGPFGFMAHPELSRESGHGSGAYGIEDLIAGLNWVHENIAAFGGDPGNVTIFGHSAGSAAVAFLSASPLSKGLFHKVIAMSGSSFTPLQTTDKDAFGMSIPSLEYAEATGTAFLNKLGVKTIAEARALPPDKIQAATRGLAFRPVADGHVVTQDLYSLYEQHRFNDTPLLIGDTSDETLAFGGSRPITSAEFEAQIRSQFGADADAILKVYPHTTGADAAQAARHVRNATTFLWNQWTWAREQSKQGKGKVFDYYYDNHAPTADGSGHGSDVPFVFQTLASGRRTPSARDLALSGMMSSYYVNFARTGDPNGKGLPTWPAFTEKNEQVMVFDAMPSARTYPPLEQVKAFEPFFERRRKEK